MGKCDVLVALIGKRWANVKKGAKSRLDNSNDFVRLEISTTLPQNIRVIPVLVGESLSFGTPRSLALPIQRRRSTSAVA